MNSSLYLGVDGGGTHCRARLVNSDGCFLGEGVSGSANPRIGIQAAWQNIMDACQQACDQGELQESDYSRVHLGLGLAGANQALEQDIVLSQAHPFAAVYLLSDAHTACLGAFSGKNGALLIFGTGSCGLNYHDGEFDVIGGWGFPVSDQGSGARIGLSALEASLAALDGIGRESSLTQEINQMFSDDASQYVLFLNRQPLPREYGVYAPLVFRHAANGDEVALAIVQEHSLWASRYLDCLLAKGAEKVVLTGGVSTALKAYLPKQYLNYLVEAEGDAMDGAIYMARHKIGRSAV
jgi:glucosamine kinase